MTTAHATRPAVGPLLRQWRQRRHLSQLELASDAGVSTRHLSFLETGRSRPSREMVVHLAEALDVPLRERNAMLAAAGYAGLYRETPIDAPEMEAVRDALDLLLASHEPYPALVVDGNWDLVAANTVSQAILTADVAAHLLAPPVNVMRVSLHPEGLLPRVVNQAEFRAHMLTRLRRQVALTGDGGLAALYREVSAYPGEDSGERRAELGGAERVVVPVRLRHDGAELSFFSTIATFGTAVDITVAELAIESFFPADAATAAALQAGRG